MDESIPLVPSFFMSRQPILYYRGPLFRSLNLKISSFFELHPFITLMPVVTYCVYYIVVKHGLVLALLLSS